MPKDTELDRLKAEQDRAFAAKQSAYDAQQAAWERRASARDTMNRAFEAQNRAYEAQDNAWKEYKRIKDHNGPRIDSLNAAQERAFENMKAAFANASSAYDSRNGAMAASYSADGRRYKEESQGYVVERRQFVNEIRAAKDRLEPYKSSFQSATATATSTRATYNTAKAAHERAQEAFKAAKASFESASAAFKRRLETVRADNNRRKNDKRSVAERAGVPYRFLDDVWVSKDSDGTTNVYFGGVGKPNGPGHGHYVMDRNGTVTYKRDPFDPHGAQNFEENRREGATLSMARMAMNQWAKQQTTSRQTQHEDSEFKVTVRSGYDQRYDTTVTDVLIFDKQNKKEHYHLIIDDHGNELFSEWRPNH